MAVKAHVMEKLTLFDRVWIEWGGPMIMLADGTSELPSFAARSFNLSGATRASRRS